MRKYSLGNLPSPGSASKLTGKGAMAEDTSFSMILQDELLNRERRFSRSDNETERTYRRRGEKGWIKKAC